MCHLRAYTTSSFLFFFLFEEPSRLVHPRGTCRPWRTSPSYQILRKKRCRVLDRVSIIATLNVSSSLPGFPTFSYPAHQVTRKVATGPPPARWRVAPLRTPLFCDASPRVRSLSINRTLLCVLETSGSKSRSRRRRLYS